MTKIMQTPFRLVAACLLALLACCVAMPVAAADAPAPTAAAAPAVNAPPRDAALEAEYSAKYYDKVKFETQRAEQSLEALWNGVTLVFAAVMAIGAVSLWATLRHQKRLDELKARVAEQS
jgi:hypothetical protein